MNNRKNKGKVKEKMFRILEKKNATHKGGKSGRQVICLLQK